MSCTGHATLPLPAFSTLYLTGLNSLLHARVTVNNRGSTAGLQHSNLMTGSVSVSVLLGRARRPLMQDRLHRSAGGFPLTRTPPRAVEHVRLVQRPDRGWAAAVRCLLAAQRLCQRHCCTHGGLLSLFVRRDTQCLAHQPTGHEVCSVEGHVRVPA